MDVKTYRARSMQEALQLVRNDLGSHAAVLHTREVPGGLWQRLRGVREIEVTASATVHVPSRFAETTEQRLTEQRLTEQRLTEQRLTEQRATEPRATEPRAVRAVRTESWQADRSNAMPPIPPAHEQDFRSQFRNDLKCQLDGLQSMVEDLCRRKGPATSPDMPDSLFHLFTDLIDAEVSEELARELIDRLRQGAARGDLDDSVLLKARIARLIEEEISVTGPLRVTPGARRLVALVGPTGVGKTTTIAKLAGNFHLRERHRVGLITVDTYRIAAVEQLRTYADIIDLPMEVVSTPREMRQAVERLADLDLILMDTAGRSPRDEVKIQELKNMLAEAEADEVHLVLSSVNSLENLKKTATQFADVGVTALVLTKLDEATGLGNLVPLLRSCRLPLSYVTNGQNVPDDIEAADRRRLTRCILGLGTPH
ncbi:MAG: flagellar biosynthesis protein FlhF [Pirellulaceae bacterium]